jgi:hypothetical protein
MSGENTSSTTSRSYSFVLPFKIVFSKWSYILIAFATALVFWIVSSTFDELLYFTPIVFFYLPEDAVVGFILATITSILLGIIVSMNIYIFKNTRTKIKTASFFSGSSLGVLSSTCASCSSLGFLLVSTLGAAGVTASNFLSNYQIPLRLLSIGLLAWAYYSVSRELMKSCTINQKQEH